MKIVIWTGGAWEPWGPPSIESGGIGGSETAAIHMAEKLALLGHEVTCFGEHDGFEGDYICRSLSHFGPTTRVVYVNYRKAVENPRLADCDVFIASRDKRAWKVGNEAKLRVLWVHDIHVGDDFEGDLRKFDRILCLTNWHKKVFAGYYPEMRVPIEVTRNGIDPQRFTVMMGPHNPQSNDTLALKATIPTFTYSSSPDRGLDKLLDMWPKIVAACGGKAELNVFYGFDTWEKMVKGHKNGEMRVAWFKSRLAESEKLGVHYHGRQPQRKIAESHMRSWLWLYPTAFKETSCITAMEAQAAGTIPVTTDLAALSETVRFGVKIRPPNDELRYQKEFFDALAMYLDGTNLRQVTAGSAREHGMRLGWDGVAKEWNESFSRWLEEKAAK